MTTDISDTKCNLNLTIEWLMVSSLMAGDGYMLTEFFRELHGSVVISSFSGAMVFTLIQKEFSGKDKVIAFLVSFFMGVLGANNTVSFVRHYFPEHPEISIETGSFICSALIVTVFMLVISRIENFTTARKKRDGETENDR
jgi:uncharacterized membrane protein YjjB (DUF3815 family)